MKTDEQIKQEAIRELVPRVFMEILPYVVLMLLVIFGTLNVGGGDMKGVILVILLLNAMDGVKSATRDLMLRDLANIKDTIFGGLMNLFNRVGNIEKHLTDKTAGTGDVPRTEEVVEEEEGGK